MTLHLGLAAGKDNEENDYQLNFNPHAPIIGNLSGFGEFGYQTEANDYSKYRFGWPGLVFSATHWLQFWGGLDAYYTDNYSLADTLELRPYSGVKLFVPNRARIQLYNFTRYEYRATQDRESNDWTDYSRIRSRFGVGVPLTSRAKAWEPKTFYVLTDVEPFYRFDLNEWDPLRVRGGLGYVLSDRIRIEAIYTAQFTRSSPGSSLEYNDNILQLNIRISLGRGLLGRLFNPDQ